MRDTLDWKDRAVENWPQVTFWVRKPSAMLNAYMEQASQAEGQSLVDVKPPSHLTGDIRPQRVVNSTLTGFEGFSGAKLFARSCSAGYCMIVTLVWKIKEQNATRDTTASSLLAAVRQAISRAAASTATTPRKAYAVTTEGAVPSPAPVIRTEDVVLTTNWSAAKRNVMIRYYRSAVRTGMKRGPAVRASHAVLLRRAAIFPRRRSVVRAERVLTRQLLWEGML
ncbi:hypothetical protein MaudCBS49596_007995 [Microsporum audouinii]